MVAKCVGPDPHRSGREGARDGGSGRDGADRFRRGSHPSHPNRREGALPFALMSDNAAHDAWFRAKVREALGRSAS